MQKEAAKSNWLDGVLYLDKFLCKLGVALTTFMFAIMICTIFIQVLCRFVFVISVPWTEELVRYLFISTTFIGAGAAFSRNDHLEISTLNAFIEKLPSYDKRLLCAKLNDIFVSFVMMCLGIFLARLFTVFTIRVYKTGQLSAAMHMPMWVLDIAILCGIVGLAIHALLRLIVSLADHSRIINPLFLREVNEE
jgi:TRAP-type C4-dicarboxylate transport system permease small subunit